MEKTVLDLFLSENPHAVLVGVIVILTIGIVALWRENRRILDRLLEVKEMMASVQRLNVAQTTDIKEIKDKTCTPSK